MLLFLQVISYVAVGLVAMAIGSLIAHRNMTPPFGRYLRRHFGRIDPSSLVVTQREFPSRVRVDLQQALDEYLLRWATIHETIGVSTDDSPMFGMSLSALLTHNQRAGAAPLQFDEIDIGEELPAPARAMPYGC